MRATVSILALAFLAGGAGRAFAVDQYVNASTGDDLNAGSPYYCDSAHPCRTLSAALYSSSWGDTIHLSAGTYLGARDQFHITKQLTIIGAGAGQTILKADGVLAWEGLIAAREPGGGSDPLFVASLQALTIDASEETVALLNGGQTISLSDCEIQNGHSSSGIGFGAGIHNYHGSLTITNCEIHHNTGHTGGGIQSVGGSLTIADSSLRDNSAGFLGGALAAFGGELLVRTTTIDGNTAGAGGGIYLGANTNAGIANSTISRNQVGLNASGDGGGICNGGRLAVFNSTIADNRAGSYASTMKGAGIQNFGGSLLLSQSTIGGNVADSGSDFQEEAGGGIYVWAGDVELINTIVAGNSARSSPDCRGTLASHPDVQHNVIGNGDGCSGIVDGVLSNQVGSAAAPLDPLFGPLGNYGGSFEVLPFRAGSPARGRGDTGTCKATNGPDGVLDTDQRGQPRRSDARGACDVGAYDHGGFLPPTIALDPSSDSGLPDGLTNDATPRFGGRADPGQTVRVEEVAGATLCSTAASAWGEWSCSTSTLADGAHQVRGSALRWNGLWSTSQPITVDVDTVAPGLKLDSAATTGRDASFAFSSSDPAATFTCQRDAAVVESCTSPIAYHDLADGHHTFSVSTSDAAGNESSVTHSWVIDAQPPSVAIVSAPAGLINAPATFRWAGADDVTAPGSLLFRHRFNGPVVGAWSAFGPATKATFTPSADGQYTLEVEARDEAENVSAPATHSFAVDVSGPAIKIEVPADGAEYVRFTEVLAKYSCTDGGAGMAGGRCLGGVPDGSPIPAQTRGSHSFTVHAQDALGNVSSRSVGYQIVNPMPVVTKFAPAAVTAGEVSTLEISGAAFVPETEVWLHSPEAQYRPVSSWSISADLTRIDVGLPSDLEPGAWTVSVSNSGGFGPLVVRLMLFVAPRGAVVSDADVSSDGSATIGGGGPGTPGSLSVSGTGGEGTLAVAEYASNPGGGVSFSSSGAFFDAYVGPGSTYTSVTITACDLNGGNFVEWWDGTRWLRAFPQSFDAANGCVTLTLTDLSSPRLSQLTGTIFGAGIDSTPPTTTAAGVAEDGPYTFGAWTSHAVLVTLSAADDPGGSGLARTAYRIDSGAEQTYAGPIALADEGAFTLEYWSEDRAGNVEPPRAVAVRIDRTPPLLSLPPDQSFEATGPEGAIFSYAASAHDALAGPLTPSCAPVSGSVFPLGGTTVTCSAADPAGNTGTGSFDISVLDTTAPAIRSLTLPNGGVLWPPNRRMVPLTVTADATDAVSTAACTVQSVSSSEAADGSGDGHTPADWRITGPLSVELRAERSGGGSGRTYTLTVECADAAGNKATGTVAASVPHDRSKP